VNRNAAPERTQLTKKSQHTTPHSALQNDRKSTRDVYPKSRFYFSFFESTCKHTHPHYRPCTQSPGLKLQINRAMPKGKLGPSATPWGLAMGTTRTPKPASPPLQSVKLLRPLLTSRLDKGCHRLKLSLRNGFDKTSPPITMETGCSQTSMQPSHSIQPSAQRQTSIVQYLV
jgi:hypothetical protein